MSSPVDEQSISLVVKEEKTKPVSHTPPHSRTRSFSLSSNLRKLKRAFKKLFQTAFETYYEDQFSKKQISVKPGFNDDVSIPLGYFNQKIRSYIKERKDAESALRVLCGED